ncbi:C-C motif chemokine 8-like [Clupea harengus]|uniref:C-C motif chemokine 8-like n=1 Tax=Clupea harengus TaxID=7950 RepID=A0A6P8EIB7_CLUHA|nr:C-C motif chemokine 8-like [Clupea harengus]
MKPLSALLSFLTMLLCYAALGKASGPVLSCCLKTSGTRVKLHLLQSYQLQNGVMCHGLNAVRFTTVRGVTICSDPSMPWARRAVSYLQKKHKSQSRNHVSSWDSKRLKPTMPENSASSAKLVSH